MRVLVVDDHPVVRAGIVGILERDPELEVVGSVEDGAAALAALEKSPVDVVLTDLRMPRMDGVELTAQIARLPAPPKVVVLTTYDSDTDILRAVEAGAIGYLLKDAPGEEIAQAIKAAAVGYASLSPQVAAALLSQVQRGQTPNPSVLTPREIEVLSQVATGSTNTQIARTLGLSLGTVKAHLEHAYTKLEVPDRASAVAKALSLGLLPH